MIPSERQEHPPERSLRSRLITYAGSLLVVCVFLAAVYVLHRELREYHLKDIEKSLSLVTWTQVFAAVGLAVVSYTILTGYDWLAVHYTQRSLPYSHIALASFVSYASSYNFGAILGGTTMRYRLYSTFGLSTVEIVKIIGICTLTFVLGFCTLAGAMFTIEAMPLPSVVRLPVETTRPIGIALLAAVAVYLAASAVRKRPVSFRGWEFSLPSPRFTVLQVIVATADIVIAASVLYALVRGEIDASFFKFVAVFLIAQFAGLCSHVPGGVGVFEAVLLVMLAPRDPPDLFGSILLYRIIYFLLPLAVAATLLAVHEGLRNRRSLSRFADSFGQWTQLLAPRVLAAVTFFCGALLLLSGALPRSVERFDALANRIPLPLIELSHFLSAVIGTGLLLIARGLDQRMRTAYRWSVVLIATGIVVSLVRGLDLEEACMLAFVLLILSPCAAFFPRKASLVDETFTLGWLVSIAVVFVAMVWIGLFSHNMEFAASLWGKFDLDDDAPRFLRAACGAALVLLSAAMVRIVRPPRETEEDEALDRE